MRETYTRGFIAVWDKRSNAPSAAAALVAAPAAADISPTREQQNKAFSPSPPRGTTAAMYDIEDPPAPLSPCPLKRNPTLNYQFSTLQNLS